MKLKQILLPTLALLIICLVVTAALSVTNHFTKDAIAKQAQQQITQTMSNLLPEYTFAQQNETTYLATKEDATVYVFLTKAMGYKSKVEVMTAIDATGTVTGVAVVNCSEESPGIGQKVGTDSGFLSQFSGAKGEINNYDAITGATYSSVAVKDAVNMALEQFRTLSTVSATNLQGGAQ